MFDIFKLAGVAALLVATVSFQPAAGEAIPGAKIGVVLMHGKGGRPDLYIGGLRSGLESAGVLVDSRLMPWGEGRIYDKSYEDTMKEIDAAVARLKADGAKKIVVAGHSIGANAALGYAARRDGLSGVILISYGHVPGIPGFARKLVDSVEKARAMIKAGDGDDGASFYDHGQGEDRIVSGTGNIILSWMDPRGPATISANAPQVKPTVPVLCIDGASEPRKRCIQISYRLPRNPMNFSTKVNAGHLGSPASSVGTVTNWLREIGAGAKTRKDASGSLDDWLAVNKQLCSKDMDHFSAGVSEHIRKLKSDNLIDSDFTVTGFKMRRLYKKTCS